MQSLLFIDREITVKLSVNVVVNKKKSKSAQAAHSESLCVLPIMILRHLFVENQYVP